MEIRNADIKFNTSGPMPGAWIFDEGGDMVSGCNITDALIESYHPPRFHGCYLEGVVSDRSAPGKKKGPIFNACRLVNVRVPKESAFHDCAGQVSSPRDLVDDEFLKTTNPIERMQLGKESL